MTNEILLEGVKKFNKKDWKIYESQHFNFFKVTSKINEKVTLYFEETQYFQLVNIDILIGTIHHTFQANVTEITTDLIEKAFNHALRLVK